MFSSSDPSEPKKSTYLSLAFDGSLAAYMNVGGMFGAGPRPSF